MSFISIPNFSELNGEAQARYENQIERNGKITNMKKILLHSTDSFDALMTWYPLFNGVKEVVGERGALFYAYAISNENDCLLCSTFFIKIFDDLGISFEGFAFTEERRIV